MTAPSLHSSRGRASGLLAVTVASPFLIYASDRGLLHLIAPMGQPWIDGVLARPASFLVCGLLYLILVRRQAADRLGWSQSLRLALAVGSVLAFASAAGVAAGAFSPSLPGAALIGFLLFGLLAEEWLFRGVVFEALRTGPWGGRGAVIGSAALFAVSHLGYHSFQPTPDALQQPAYTFPLGLALGWLRARTGRIAPGAVAHLMFNLTGLIATAVLR